MVSRSSGGIGSGLQMWLRWPFDAIRGVTNPEPGSTFAVLRRLLTERARDYAWQYGVAFAFMGIVAASTALSAWMMKDVINRIFVERNQAALFWIPLAVVIIFVMKGLASYFQEIMLSRIGNRMVADTQRRLYDHLLQMDVGFYQNHPSHDLTARISYSAGAAREMLNLIALSLGRDLLTLLSLIAVMVAMNPTMAAVALLVGPFASVGLRQLVRRAQKASRSEVLSASSIIGVVRETSQGVRIVKSFQLEPVLRAKMFAAIEAVERVGNRIARTQAGVNPLIETLGGVSVALVILYAGWRSIGHTEAPGEFFAFITSLLMAADPARRLSRVQIQLATCVVGVRMMYELLDTPVTEAPNDCKPELVVAKGAIRFEDVSFSYQPGVRALDRLSLDAQAGGVTAIVGPSGGGKSTVFNLLQHFWTPQGGRILIDGQSINEVQLASLRRQIALVSQDVFLFDGTIRENIQAGRSDVNDEKLREATRSAHAEDFIQAMPMGYDTPVGELGGHISGGQRQRISIARAFLKDAPIILLDEPTSALDSESEHIIQQALRELTRGRTTLVIAHRLATILHADVIHVIDGGKVVETGSHTELLARGGLYARFFRMQFAGGAEQLPSSKTESLLLQ